VSLNFDVIGVESSPAERTWTGEETLLYALAVGAGQEDPLAELEFTTENSAGVEQKVLPTFANMIAGGGGGASLGDFDFAAVVHADQAFTVHRPLPVAGTARSTSRVTGMYDKGSAAMVVLEATASDADTGELLATTRTSIFIRGEGSFGGDRGPGRDWEIPTRPADERVTYRTGVNQALIYRLTGDRNPLHSDPKFAARAGFSQPILHGMCTYGYTGRALLHTVCGSDPARFLSMESRFTRPVLPGEELAIEVWADAGTAYFRTTSGGVPVIDYGRMTFRD
jgi:acyl dehydratase